MNIVNLLKTREQGYSTRLQHYKCLQTRIALLPAFDRKIDNTIEYATLRSDSAPGDTEHVEKRVVIRYRLCEKVEKAKRELIDNIRTKYDVASNWTDEEIERMVCQIFTVLGTENELRFDLKYRQLMSLGRITTNPFRLQPTLALTTLLEDDRYGITKNKLLRIENVQFPRRWTYLRFDTRSSQRVPIGRTRFLRNHIQLFSDLFSTRYNYCKCVKTEPICDCCFPISKVYSAYSRNDSIQTLFRDIEGKVKKIFLGINLCRLDFDKAYMQNSFIPHARSSSDEESD